MREMKDSGIEWIGEIPKDWDKGHLKYYTQIKTGGTPSTSNQVWFDGDVLWFTPGDFDNILLNDSKRKLSNLAVLFRVANLFPANTTMIVGIGGTAGKVGYTIKESYCNQQITALINKSNTYPKYITYLMFCFSDVLKDNALYTTLPILNNQFIGNFSICIPKKLSEQRKIADFLDSKCSEIDATAEDIQKEISLLEDYKKSVITEAVTKGLNPDAEMKDSGIEWIGDINQKASLCRLKFFSYMKGRIGWQGLKSEDFIDNGPYCVTGTDFINGKINWDTCYHVSEERYKMDSNIQLKIGDLLVTKDGTIGKLAKVTELPEKACLNSHLLIIRPLNERFSNEYLYYVISSDVFVRYYKYSSTGSTMESLSQEKLGNFIFPVYDLLSQQQIVDYLDFKCSEIDTIIADKKRQLDILADYKKSLIYEYVTGKKDVPVNDF